MFNFNIKYVWAQLTRQVPSWIVAFNDGRRVIYFNDPCLGEPYCGRVISD